MTAAEPGSGGKVLVKINDVAILLEANEAMELARQLAGAAMSASVYSGNGLLPQSVEGARLRRMAYTP